MGSLKLRSQLTKIKLDFCGGEVKVIRSARKSIAVQIRPEGMVVRAPMCMSGGDIAAFLERKRPWIEKHLAECARRQQELTALPAFSEEELKALTAKAKEQIPKRVAYYAPLVGVSYARITIRCQRTRWGSCSDRGNLNFNCLLMLLPDDVLDSVVVHELCHRKFMDHSPRFYAELERVFPDYLRCSKWLKEHGIEYLSRLP